MISSTQHILVCAFAMILSVATSIDTERPKHMQRKANLHRNGTKSLLASGTIDSTLELLERNRDSNSGLRGVRGNFECNDADEITPTGYSCSNMDQLAFVSNAELGSRAATHYTKCDDDAEMGFDYISEVWGWESNSSGKKYAIACLWDGTSFVDITNPSEPAVLGFLEMEGDLESGNCYDGYWRDVKVVGDHAYIGAEPENSGVQVVDLARLDTLPRPTGSETLTRGDVARIEADSFIDSIGGSHNIIAFEEAGKVLVVGYGKVDEASACDREKGETVAIFDVAADPLDPPVECLDVGSSLNQENQKPYAQMNTYPGYVHDGQCFVYDGPDSKYTSVPMCIFFAETEIGIYDMSNGDLITKFTYPGAAYVHQGWISEDFTTLYANDEADEECRSGMLDGCSDLDNPSAYPSTRIFDISSLENVGEAREFVNDKPHPSIDHNMYVRGGYIYSANYEAGARVYRIEEDNSLTEVAYFDVSKDCDDIVNCADPFGGTWTHFPYSDPSTTIASNGFYGLHVLRVRLEENTNLFE